MSDEISKPKAGLQAYIRSDNVMQRIEALLDKRAPQFVASLMSVVNSNPVLQECKPESVVSAAVTAASMDLPITPGLGFAFIIPYNNSKKITETYLDGNGVERKREKWIKEYSAQFQMGWKGFVQLAQRSNMYRTINTTDVREGEYKGKNRMTGEIMVEWVDDEEERNKLAVVGYLAYFKSHSGFEKMLYMTVEEVERHAKKYSKSYANGNGLWAEDFDAMALKTVVKLLISRWGSMSTEMQKAIQADQADLEEDSYKYVDNDKGKKKASKKALPAKAKAKKPAAKKAAEKKPEPVVVPEPTEEPAIKPNTVTLPKKDQDEIIALVESLGLSIQGRMHYTKKATGVPTTHMFKNDDQWQQLREQTQNVLDGKAELDPAWLAK